MGFVATFLLIIVLVIRPQEIWPALGSLHLLEVLTGLSALGVLVDFMRGRRSPYTPQIPFLLAFLFFAYFATVLGIGRTGFSLVTTRIVISSVFMLAVAYGARHSPRQLAMIYGLLLALGLFVGVVAIHQGRQEPSCLEVPPDAVDGREEGEDDGRNCENRADCRRGGRSDVDYECERLGWFKTVSVERRVRWRGQLGDPNELAVFLGAVIPFAFVLMARVRRAIAIPLTLVMLGVLLWAVILSQSRGGQLVVGVVAASYGISRLGWKRGLFVAAVLALPVVLLGGRSGADADASADERLDILYDAITEFAHHPLFGRGVDQFTEDHRLTAHNAYVLAAVDLGFFGFFAWTGMIYASLKIPYVVVRHPPANLDPRIRDLAFATLVSFAGMTIGIFFLSFTYKQLLFVWIGISGAIYGAVKNDDPDFEVKITWKDLLAIAGFVAALSAIVLVYTRLHVR